MRNTCSATRRGDRVVIKAKEEWLISGKKCYAVTGRDEVLERFVDSLGKCSYLVTTDVRIIGGKDPAGRIKIVLTGQFVSKVPFSEFKKKFIRPFKLNHKRYLLSETLL